jgi:hypothetical protein
LRASLASESRQPEAAARAQSRASFNMQQLLNHVRSDIFDLITITRKSRAYKLLAIEAAAKAMVEYMRQKDAQ